MRISAALLAIAVLTLSACTNEDRQEPLEERSVAIYLVRDGKVAPVRRTVSVQPSLESLVAETLGSLVDGPTSDEANDGYGTDVALEARATSVADGVVTVEPTADGSLSDLGTAQIVHTLSRLPEVRGVRLGGGEALTTRSFESQTPQVLVESPLPGETVTSPIRLRGTANVFEATVSLEVRDAADEVVLESFTTATSGNGTRGTFEAELAVPDVEGPLTIVAFESSAEDGRPLHVFRVPVTLAR